MVLVWLLFNLRVIGQAHSHANNFVVHTTDMHKGIQFSCILYCLNVVTDLALINSEIVRHRLPLQHNIARIKLNTNTKGRNGMFRFLVPLLVYKQVY